jgi:uncharacterized membrane protein
MAKKEQRHHDRHHAKRRKADISRAFSAEKKTVLR